MIYIDILIVIVIIWFAFRGLKNGLIKELTGIAAISFGIIFSMKFSSLMSELLSSFEVSDSEYIPILSFTAVFIIVIILTFFISKIVNKFVKIIKLDWLNKIAGLIFGCLKILLILSAVFFIINSFYDKILMTNNSLFEDSILYEPITKILDSFFPYIENFKVNEKFKDLI